jgi:hypothetical protein
MTHKEMVEKLSKILSVKEFSNLFEILLVDNELFVDEIHIMNDKLKANKNCYKV